MDKLREYIMMTLNWLWNDEDANMICNEIYNDIKNDSELNSDIQKRGYLGISAVQTATKKVLKERLLA